MELGDIAWVLAATALVMLMTPALGFYYAGLVRRKNLISTIGQCFVIYAVVSLLWAFWGYSLAFGPSILRGFIGDLSWAGLNNVGLDPGSYSPTIPAVLHFSFQLTFAAITPALIIGAFAERIKFRSMILFMILWSTFIYPPIAHWVWNIGGWIHILGAIDFAGGTVVHVNAGFSALAAALVIGRRRGLKEGLKPANVPFVLLGAALLWFGWFGFNAGSALSANKIAASAFTVTNLAAAAAAISYMIVDWVLKGKPTTLSLGVGAVCGLVAITPASGYVNTTASIIIGLVAGIISNLVAVWRKKTRIDDALDVWACHGMSGIWGSLATGLFATKQINPGGADGLFYGNPSQLIIQLIAVIVVLAYSFVGSFILLRLVNAITPLRVSEREEDEGLDQSQHGEVYMPSEY